MEFYPIIPQDLRTTASPTFVNLILGGYITGVDYIDFDITFSGSPMEGRLQWNTDDGVLEFGLPGGTSVLQIGTENVTRATNAEASQIDNGEVVYVSGGTGAFPDIMLADNSSIATAWAVAVATEDITAAQKGYMTSFGLVRDINTATIGAAGTIAWLGTSGGLTGTRPTAPTTQTAIGVVIRSHATEGVLLVRPVVVQRMAYASDVYTSSIADNDIYQWVDGNSRFENTGTPTFGTTTLTGGLIAPITTITSDTTLTDANYTVLIDTSGGNVSATLPASPTTGQLFNIKCVDATSTATVAGNGNNIDTAASMTLDLHESITIQYDGTEWWIL